MRKLSEERIYYLLKSYSEETATETELQELYEWVVLTPGDSEIKRYVKTLLEESEGKEFPEVDWDSLYHQILENTEKEEAAPERKNNWWKVAAVVLVLIVGSGAIYWFATKDKLTSDRPIVARETNPLYHNHIQPGSTKAMLTAGHQSVLLNSTDTSFSMGGNQVKISNGKIQVSEKKPVEYTLTVPRGGTYNLVLADGTKVWLNADSKLVYPSAFTGDTRTVKLRGEGYFDVTTDAEHPFVIHTAQEDVNVLGTEVNVTAYEDEVNKTTLVQGKVAVEYEGERKILQPGQQALLQQNGGRGDRHFMIKKVDVNQEVAWKNGYFRFDRADISTIMKKLERWYNIEVEYNGAVPQQHFGAIMNRKNNIARILNLLEATGDVHFEIEGNTVKVSK